MIIYSLDILLSWFGGRSVVPCPVLTVASWPAYLFLRRQARESSIPISLRIFQFVVIHTVKGFGIVNKAKWSEVTQSCPTLCYPMECSPPGSSVLGILRARILEWIAISLSRGTSRPRDQTQVLCIAGRRFNLWATREAKSRCFFWNSLDFSMIQWMLAIWSLVPLPFLNPAWTSESSWFMYCWRLAWRILSITLLACEMSAIVQ